MVSDRVVSSVEIHSTRYVGPDGKALGTLPGWASDQNEMVTLYRAMVLTRAFDERAVALQRSGQLGTFPSSLGQEAVAIGTASAMKDRDVLLPSHREQGAQLWRGVTMVELLLYWGGDERGGDFAGPREDFPVSVPVGSHASHAAGVAMAFQLRRDPRVAVCVIGDGATSKGDFYEALNFAGIRRLPVVFVVNNNQWAISVPRSAQTAADTLAQKAVAAGVHGEQVDGNDVVAVRDRAAALVERARAGHGAAVMEAVTYRLSDHTTADDASRYRAAEEVSARWSREPLSRVRTMLADRGWWGPRDEEELLAGVHAQVESAVQEYLGVEPARAEVMFDHLYANLPPSLRAQRDEVARRWTSPSTVPAHG